MEFFKNIASDWLDKFKGFLVGIMAFLFVAVTCAGSFVVGSLAVIAGLAMIFAKLLWPIFVLLVLLAGFGLLLGVIVV